MKMNIEIEIDYIDEEGNLDDAIKNEIIDNVSNRLWTENKSFSLDEAYLKATKEIDNKINETLAKLFDGFMKKPFIISDGWNKSTSYSSVYEYLEVKFEKALKVELKNNSYGLTSDFLKYFQNEIDKTATAFISKTLKEIQEVGNVIFNKSLEENKTLQALKSLLDKAKEK